MKIASETSDLWTLAMGGGEIDPSRLLAAVEAEIIRPNADFRTRVLIRDSLRALQTHWGQQGLVSKISPTLSIRLQSILNEQLGDKGFASLKDRMMESVRVETIEAFFRELGLSLHERVRLEVGGSCGLMLANLIRRRTDDIDAVDEVPAAVRNQHGLLDSLATRYGLRLAHFQSHYLPDGWRGRLRSFGVYGLLEVFLVDSADILVGKLFSNRDKDLDDLRLIVPAIGRAALESRLISAGKSLASEIKFRQNAERNWYILFGTDLPGV